MARHDEHLILCQKPHSSVRAEELEVRESERGVEVFVPCEFGAGVASGPEIRGHWLAPAPASVGKRASLVLVSEPHYWPGRFAALLAKTRWAEGEAVRFSTLVGDAEVERMQRAGILGGGGAGELDGAE